jgi:hypothetical protein
VDLSTRTSTNRVGYTDLAMAACPRWPVHAEQATPTCPRRFVHTDLAHANLFSSAYPYPAGYSDLSMPTCPYRPGPCRPVLISLSILIRLLRPVHADQSIPTWPTPTCSHQPDHTEQATPTCLRRPVHTDLAHADLFSSACLYRAGYSDLSIPTWPTPTCSHRKKTKLLLLLYFLPTTA